MKGGVFMKKMSNDDFKVVIRNIRRGLLCPYELLNSEVFLAEATDEQIAEVREYTTN